LAVMCPTERERYEADLKIYRDNMAVLKTARVEGFAEGLAEGEARGEARGRVEGKIEDIVSLLEDKFGPVPASLVAALSAIEDFAILKSLLIKASRSASFEEFESALR